MYSRKVREWEAHQVSEFQDGQFNIVQPRSIRWQVRETSAGTAVRSAVGADSPQPSSGQRSGTSLPSLACNSWRSRSWSAFSGAPWCSNCQVWTKRSHFADRNGGLRWVQLLVISRDAAFSFSSLVYNISVRVCMLHHVSILYRFVWLFLDTTHTHTHAHTHTLLYVRAWLVIVCIWKFF